MQCEINVHHEDIIARMVDEAHVKKKKRKNMTDKVGDITNENEEEEESEVQVVKIHDNDGKMYYLDEETEMCIILKLKKLWEPMKKNRKNHSLSQDIILKKKLKQNLSFIIYTHSTQANKKTWTRNHDDIRHDPYEKADGRVQHESYCM